MLTGASQDMRRARETQGVLKGQWAQPDVIVLPAHDPTVFERLGEERS